MEPTCVARLLSDVGEKAVVNGILKCLPGDNEATTGRGSDAAGIRIGSSDWIAAAIDRCPTPLAFKLDPRRMGVWGDLAVTCVASDLLASGALPSAFLVCLLLPRSLQVSDVEDIMTHAQAVAAGMGARIVAGDTKEAPSITVVTVGLGTPVRGRTISRQGATDGDIVVLTGEIGAFTAAQLAFERGMAHDELEPELTKQIFAPRPALEAARELLSTLEPRAGMDLSDGLLCTLFTLAQTNGLGIDLYEKDLLIPHGVSLVAERFSVSALRLAFGTGDWQIAYAISEEDWSRTAKNANSPCRSVGKFTSSHLGVRLISGDGNSRKLRRIEQQHFLDSSADSSYLEYLLATPLFEV